MRSLIFAALVTTGAAGNAAHALEELVFGIISTESSQNLARDFEPMRADLQASLNMPVKLFFAGDYSGVIEGMRFNKVQLAWHGNKSAIDAVDRGGGEVFAQCIDKDGNPGYWSLIIVHKDSPIMSLEQLLANGKSLTFSNGDPQSTSGFLVPGYYAFGVNGVDPAKHFKVVRTGNHESNALAVANKQVDAATFNTEAMFKLENSRPADAQKLRPIWKSPLIASDPMVYRSDMEPGVKTRVREFFLTYGKTEEQRAKLAPLKWSGFKASDNNQLLPYRQLNFIREKAKLMADDKLDATAKAARIAELDAKVKEIDAQIAKLPKAEEAAAPAK